MVAPPHVWNPVLQEDDLAARWTVESFTNFKRELAEANALVDEAVATDDLVEAADAWRELLGDDFPQPGPGQLGLVLGDTSHQQSFAARGWKYAPDGANAISISATEQRGTKGKPREYVSGGPAIFAGHKIRFKAVTRFPYRSEIWWQVTNTGNHAAQVTNGLRGQFLEAKSITNGGSNDSSVHWESTSYTGAHRVRALLVRQNTVVGVSPYIEVNIWSKNWRHGRV